MKYTPDTFAGIDQASRSGWCIVSQGIVVAHGVARGELDVVQVVAKVRELCAGDMTRVLVVLEDHSDVPLSNKARFGRRTGAPERNTASILGMGDARGGWRQEFGRFGHPESLRMLVTSEDWRMRVLGVSNRLGTDALKDEAKRWAQGKVGAPVEDDNEAEAIAIASWAALDGVARLEQRRTVGRIKARDKRGAAKQLGLPDMPAHKTAVQRSSSGRF
jgi:hypothetical protein